MTRLPQLRLRLAELQRLRDDYRSKGSRLMMVSYIETLIADAEQEIEQIESQGRATLPDDSSNSTYS